MDYVGAWRRSFRVCLCAGTLATGTLAAERAQPNGPKASEAEAEPPDADRAYRLGPAQGKPAYVRAGAEMLGVLSLGVAQYWMNAGANSRDWDFPRWSGRWSSSAIRFDNNTHVTNNVLHPLAGAAYYGLSRANGLGVGASALYTFASSAVWEWGIEWREKISINDMITTSVGGIATGEFLIQLASYLNSAPGETSAAQDIAKGTLGLAIWLHDRIDQRLPDSTSSRDNLGFSSRYRHRFAVGYETFWLEQVNEPSQRLRGVALEARLVSLPGFLIPETFATTFAQGNFSSGALELRFDGAGLREAEMSFAAVLAGYYAQQRVNSGVVGALMGLATGLDFSAKDTGGEGDQYALVHVAGPELGFAWKWQAYQLGVSVRAFADFASIRSLAWPAVQSRDPGATYKSSLDRRYQYNVGLSSWLTAELRLYAARLSVELGLGSYRSIQGFDRFQEEITRDLGGTELLEQRRAQFSLEPPGLPLRVYAELGATSHRSSLGGQLGERDDRRSSVGVGLVF